ncbi:MAG: hypothetical protein V1809_04930 [Planctomycetota bacterium]
MPGVDDSFEAFRKKKQAAKPRVDDAAGWAAEQRLRPGNAPKGFQSYYQRTKPIAEIEKEIRHPPALEDFTASKGPPAAKKAPPSKFTHDHMGSGAATPPDLPGKPAAFDSGRYTLAADVKPEKPKGFARHKIG